ncbi:MAG: acyl-ACP--UDP-N-acetylglucosamine O-acyltransferase [Kiritimatiellae bacterium]|nr:acyl-ACP--UDP-N-acetylglucosamine O-acyltransferase [Kiritimatiellia bacterium]MDD5520219.1 acyl-ACP--UDP-N-acetylglucosamine O-acyltransferase [Kiritimatiellia bacterium]
MAIHPTAIIDKGAVLGAGVDVGPYSVIGSNVRIGENTRIMPHVVIDGWTVIGRGCTVFPFACIGTQTQDLKYKGSKTFVEIGDRTTIREYVTINSGTNEGEKTIVGSGCHIMAYCHVAHACVVGNEVIMSNCATLAGHVIIENQAIMGGLSAVHQFTRVGKMCMVGGLTKITQDCPPFMIVEGNPAEVRGPNSVGLKRRNVDENAQRLIKEAYRILYREGLSTSQAVEKIKAELELCPEIMHLLAFIDSSERGIIK